MDNDLKNILREASLRAAREHGAAGDAVASVLAGESPRSALADLAAAEASKHVKNPRLAALAGEGLRRVVAGERTSTKQAVALALAALLNRKGN